MGFSSGGGSERPNEDAAARPNLDRCRARIDVKNLGIGLWDLPGTRQHGDTGYDGR